jgi:anti-anti-sigma factor
MADESEKTSKISIARVGNHMVITLRGSLTHETCDPLETKVNDLIQHKKQWVIMDFKSVPFIDSRALEALLRVNAALNQHGGALKLIGLGPVCWDILIVTRLINIFQTFEDIHQAIRAKT